MQAIRFIIQCGNGVIHMTESASSEEGRVLVQGRVDQVVQLLLFELMHV